MCVHVVGIIHVSVVGSFCQLGFWGSMRKLVSTLNTSLPPRPCHSCVTSPDIGRHVGSCRLSVGWIHTNVGLLVITIHTVNGESLLSVSTWVSLQCSTVTQGLTTSLLPCFMRYWLWIRGQVKSLCSRNGGVQIALKPLSQTARLRLGGKTDDSRSFQTVCWKAGLCRVACGRLFVSGLLLRIWRPQRTDTSHMLVIRNCYSTSFNYCRTRKWSTFLWNDSMIFLRICSRYFQSTELRLNGSPLMASYFSSTPWVLMPFTAVITFSSHRTRHTVWALMRLNLFGDTLTDWVTMIWPSGLNRL